MTANIRHTLCTMAMLLAVTVAKAQCTISYNVVDDKKAPIKGARAIAFRTRKVTTTDAEGLFTLSVPAGKQTIRIICAGYNTQEIEVNAVDGQTLGGVVQLTRNGNTAPPAARESSAAVSTPVVQESQESAEELYAKGKKFHDNNDYARAMLYYKQAAKQNYAPAQNAIGYLYNYGQGVALNYETALAWYYKAAAQNNIHAINNIGLHFREGEGVAQDYKKAMEWFQKGAALNSARSYSYIGYLYENGYGVEKDCNKAIEFYQKAFSIDGTTGAIDIGYMYLQGNGVEEDNSKALEWFHKAADKGDDAGQWFVGYMYFNGYGVGKDNKKAMEWFLKAAQQNNASAQYNVGQMYEYGDGVDKDLNGALAWYKKAAANGHKEASTKVTALQAKLVSRQAEELVQKGNQCYETKDYLKALAYYRKAAEMGYAKGQVKVGNMYYYGYGVSEDYAKALIWYLKAAEQGDAVGQSYAGMLYVLGEKGVKEDEQKAVYWIQKSADQNFYLGQCHLGTMYTHGYGVPQDYKKALEWFNKAADQGFNSAQFHIGEAYENGRGVERDVNEALEWYKMAYANGHEEAGAKIQQLESGGQGAAPAKAESPQGTKPQMGITVASATQHSTPQKDINNAEKRIALIIGNNDYAEGALQNPVNDAKSLARKLSAMGFKVMTKTNLNDKKGMTDVVKSFYEQATNSDVVFFFYAGHATQSKGINYLLPTGATPKSPADYEDECVKLRWIMDKLDDANIKHKIVVLDACRNDPLGRGAGGLAEVSSVPDGTLLVFSTKAGTTAHDGSELGLSNSPFTTALLKVLDEPNMEIHQRFVKVREMVVKLTNGEQKPTTHDELESVYF